MRSHSDCIANVLREFFKEDDGYISERVLQEINHVNSKSEKAKASANARWSNNIKDLPDDANAMRTHSERNATQDPIPNTHNTIKESATKVAKPKASILKNDWELPDEWAIWAKKERPELNVNQVADGFKDYWISEAKAKADWFATWRYWIRKQRAERKDSEKPWVKENREWFDEAAGRKPTFEKDIFEMETINQPRIAK
jgi:hypothetical protein